MFAVDNVDIGFTEDAPLSPALGVPLVPLAATDLKSLLSDFDFANADEFDGVKERLGSSRGENILLPGNIVRGEADVWEGG